MNITVYLGSSNGVPEIYAEKARELGEWIASNGDVLVYGGSKVGLMGILAQSCVNKGGKAIGVEPSLFVDQEKQYDGVTELIVTKDMQERKKKMLQLGELFIAFPGGTGTLEEISEALSMEKLGFMKKICCFYNINGYYDPMKKMFDKMAEEGFITREDRKRIRIFSSLDQIAECAETMRGGSV